MQLQVRSCIRYVVAGSPLHLTFVFVCRFYVNPWKWTCMEPMEVPLCTCRNKVRALLPGRSSLSIPLGAKKGHVCHCSRKKRTKVAILCGVWLWDMSPTPRPKKERKLQSFVVTSCGTCHPPLGKEKSHDVRFLWPLNRKKRSKIQWVLGLMK